ncbi:hypothetical protein HAV15_001847 [Penicillium sp. str. |nr:hypothetical protein HAV15_001847 [Penicillium sp. str. \
MAPPSDKQSRLHPPPRPQQTGAVDAPNPPQPGVSGPPPPNWLAAGLSKLKQSHPNDSFEGVMRYSAAGQNIKYQYLPRIRCHDCPGKLYTPGPGMTVDNFEVHLRNRQHKERVEERLTKTGGDGGSASASPRMPASASPALGTATVPGAHASPSSASGSQP